MATNTLSYRPPHHIWKFLVNTTTLALSKQNIINACVDYVMGLPKEQIRQILGDYIFERRAEIISEVSRAVDMEDKPIIATETPVSGED